MIIYLEYFLEFSKALAYSARSCIHMSVSMQHRHNRYDIVSESFTLSLLNEVRSFCPTKQIFKL